MIFMYHLSAQVGREEGLIGFDWLDWLLPLLTFWIILQAVVARRLTFKIYYSSIAEYIGKAMVGVVRSCSTL